MTHPLFEQITATNEEFNVQEKVQIITQLFNSSTFDQKENIGALLRKNGILLNVYENPTPVAVGLVPVSTNDGIKLLAVIRNIEPKKGEACLPCGYVDKLEDAQHGAAREIFEETGLDLSSDDFSTLTTRVSPGNTLLVFCRYAHIVNASDIDLDFKNHETQKVILADRQQNFCFPLHNDVAQIFWNSLD